MPSTEVASCSTRSPAIDVLEMITGIMWRASSLEQEHGHKNLVGVQLAMAAGPWRAVPFLKTKRVSDMQAKALDTLVLLLCICYNFEILRTGFLQYQTF